MSTDIVAVKHIRNVQEKRGAGEENEIEMEILEHEEHHADLGSHKARPHTQKNPAFVKRGSFKAAVTLGVIYLLILAGIFMRYISAILEKEQLQRRYNNLHNSHSHLQDEVKQLQRQTAGLQCPEGWMKFGCSCYNKFTERKKWEESRTDCQKRGADLVIINSKEEQEFIRELNNPGASWIGLKAEYSHKPTGWEPKWEWVDGSPLTIMFWETGHSQKTWHHYVECCSRQGNWTQSRHYNSNNWICEKSVS